ncbi:hypothetical protein Vafri_20799 [Volvox africanus]|uniref:RNase H type-1 domain-containing protein n=1 Tax=Volvox africanus TaxID=51714 RepID=A0A8J4BSW7_9CHLO|nr:hypothetical protein Vafri_20799 [Volvox africanus]
MHWNSGASMRLRGEVSTASVHQGSGALATTNTQTTMQPKAFLSLIWRISASQSAACQGKISSMRTFASAWERTCTDSPRSISTRRTQNLVKSCSLGFPAQGRRLPSVITGDANCLTTSIVGAGGVSRCASCTPAAALGERLDPSSPVGFLLGDIDDDDDEEGGAEDGLGADLGRASSKGRDRRRGASVYAVARGRKMGIFYKWEEAELAVRGFSGAVYKKFSTERAARSFIESRTAQSAHGGGEPGSAASANGSGALPAALKPQPPPEPIGPFYAVSRGHQSGVFLSWAEAKAAVQGAAGVVYKRFNTRAEAEQFLAQHRQPQPSPSPSGDSRDALAPTEATGPGPASGKSGKRPRGRRPRKEPWSLSESATAAAAAVAVTAAPAGALYGDRLNVARNNASGDGGGSGGSSECCELTEGAEVDGGVQKPIKLVAETMMAAVTSDTATDTATGGLWPPGQPDERPMGLVSEVPDWSTEWQSGPAPTFYAVARGKQVGIFTSWADARAAVEGVSGAQFRRFKRLPEAHAFLTLVSSQQQQQQPQQQQLVVEANQNSVPAREARHLPGGVSITAAISRTNGSNGDGGSAVSSDIQDGGIKMDNGIDAGGGGGGGGVGGGGGEEHLTCSTSNTRCCSDTEAERLHDEEGASSVQRVRLAMKAVAKSTADAPCGTSTVAETEAVVATTKHQHQQLRDDEGGKEMMMMEEEGELLHFGGLTGEVDPSRTYRLEFDGGSRRNPGDAGFGAVLVDVASGRHVEYVAGPLSSSSNNVAEWSALVAGMQVAIDMGVRHLIVQGDSELVCRQVSGRYAVNTPALQPLAARMCRLRGRLDSFDVVHVPRSANAAADLLSNVSMDAEEVVAAVVSEDSAEPPSAATGLQPRRRRRVRKQLRDQLQPIIRELGEPALQGARAAIAAAATAAATLSEAPLETTNACGTETACSETASATAAVQSAGGGSPGTPGRSLSRQECSPTPPVGSGGRHGRRVQVLATECAPPVAARGSAAGSMEAFKRVLIAMACASHGLLE